MVFDSGKLEDANQETTAESGTEGKEQELSERNNSNDEKRIQNDTKFKKMGSIELGKVGPQKQKKSLHTLLKKAKIYEIRKLTRRIEVLRNLKGTEEQKSKNQRKCDKFIKEINAMKGFIIETLTERTISVFKGTANKIYLDIWNASQDQKRFEELLQAFSNSPDSEEKYNNIAYLKMLASKDISKKFKLVTEGISINARKNKKDSKKRKIKHLKNAEQKKDVHQEKTRKYTEDQKDQHSEECIVLNESLVTKVPQNQPKQVQLKNHQRSMSASKKGVTKKAGQKEPIQKKDVIRLKVDHKGHKEPTEKKEVMRLKVDSFFLDHKVMVSEDEFSSDGIEEFSAPVPRSKQLERPVPEKKNRMGQRTRQKMQQEKQNADKRRRFNSRPGLFTKPRSNYKVNDLKGKSFSKTYMDAKKTKGKVVDTSLHPSWQAKQKQKAQQTVGAFTGTKITFDD